MTEWTPDLDKITYLAATHTRGKNTAFGIRAKDRDKHMYIIGKSGMGKSTLLENMAIQDIQNGEGMFFIDPHGSTAERLLDFVPQDRIKDVMYFGPFDTEYPIGFNILEDVGYDNRHKVVAGLMGVFERIWADAWSARMQYILQNTLFALLEYPGATIIDVNRVLVNKAFREEVVNHITDPVVGMFWKEEFAGYSDKYTQEATPAIQNKVGQFVSNPLIRNILGQAKSTFDFRTMMDERKIVIMNLSKGRMGETNSTLLGSMLVIKIYLAALTRAEEPASVIAKLPNCYFYVDEFQNVVNKAFENILSEARKYKLCLTIANQYIEQMPEEVRNAVFGNVGSTVIFRVGPMDAQFLEPVFAPTFMPEDMVGLGKGDIYLTLMIDGIGSAPFSAHTLPPVDAPSISYREDVVYWSRSKFGRSRAEVEKEIKEAGERWLLAAREKHKFDSTRGQQKTAGMPPRREVRQPAESTHAGMPKRMEGTHTTRPSVGAAPHTASAPAYGSRPRTETPARHAPEAPTRSPADVLRDMTHAKKPQSHADARPQQHKPDARDALKAAIRAAAHAQPHREQKPPLQAARQFVSQPNTSPAQPRERAPEPVRPSLNPHPRPAPPPPQNQNTTNRSPSEVDADELRKLLYGDE